jgi:hypothetical protein
MFIAPQPLVEVAGVAVSKVRARFGQLLLQQRRPLRRHGQGITGENGGPRRESLRPQIALGLWTDSGYVAEGVF